MAEAALERRDGNSLVPQLEALLDFAATSPRALTGLDSLLLFYLDDIASTENSASPRILSALNNYAVARNEGDLFATRRSSAALIIEYPWLIPLGRVRSRAVVELRPDFLDLLARETMTAFRNGSSVRGLEDFLSAMDPGRCLSLMAMSDLPDIAQAGPNDATAALAGMEGQAQSACEWFLGGYGGTVEPSVGGPTSGFRGNTCLNDLSLTLDASSGQAPLQETALRAAIGLAGDCFIDEVVDTGGPGACQVCAGQTDVENTIKPFRTEWERQHIEQTQSDGELFEYLGAVFIVAGLLTGVGAGLALEVGALPAAAAIGLLAVATSLLGIGVGTYHAGADDLQEAQGLRVKYQVNEADPAMGGDDVASDPGQGTTQPVDSSDQMEIIDAGNDVMNPDGPVSDLACDSYRDTMRQALQGFDRNAFSINPRPDEETTGLNSCFENTALMMDLACRESAKLQNCTEDCCPNSDPGTQFLASRQREFGCSLVSCPPDTRPVGSGTRCSCEPLGDGSPQTPPGGGEPVWCALLSPWPGSNLAVDLLMGRRALLEELDIANVSDGDAGVLVISRRDMGL
jgi:hypothetical protein